LILGCDKGGKYDSSGSSTTSASKKCNCPFKIRVTPSTDGSGWKVHVKCGVHNHGLPDQYAGHPRKAHLTVDETKRVEDFTTTILTYYSTNLIALFNKVLLKMLHRDL
jgi:alpha-glucosidase